LIVPPGKDMVFVIISCRYTRRAACARKGASEVTCSYLAECTALQSKF
jgi:hypothetical protein